MPKHHELPYRRAWTIALLVAQIVTTAFHCVPRLVYPARPTTTAGVVALYQQLGPIWILLFGLTSLGLLVGLRWNRGLHWAHGAAMVSWVMYSAVLFTGAFATGGTKFFPALVLILAGLHATCAWFYNDDDERRARLERQ
jgi:hypothetical protein